MVLSTQSVVGGKAKRPPPSTAAHAAPAEPPLSYLKDIARLHCILLGFRANALAPSTSTSTPSAVVVTAAPTPVATAHGAVHSVAAPHQQHQQQQPLSAPPAAHQPPPPPQHLPPAVVAGISHVVGIDGKIEQAMDLVKAHLMYAVREEVDALRARLGELEKTAHRLESENALLREHIAPDVLARLPPVQLAQRHDEHHPASVSISSQSSVVDRPKE